MKLKKKYVRTVVAVIVLCLAGGAAYWMWGASDPSTMTARVTEAIYRPNRAEDGYRAYTVRTDNGSIYTINATGYMNTPIRPEDRDQDCLDTSSIKQGQVIEFKLPKADFAERTFVTCYDKNASDYFIRQK